MMSILLISLASSTFFLFLFYPIWRLVSVWHRRRSHMYAAAVSVLLLTTMLGPRFLPQLGESIQTGGNYLLGFFLFACMGTALFDIMRWLSFRVGISWKISLRAGVSSVWLFSAALVALSVYNFYQPIVLKHVEIFSQHVSRSYQLLHITDTQYGSLNDQDISTVSTRIAEVLAQYPVEAVLFTGDMVDSEVSEAGPLLGLDTGLPQFFSLGNHEFYHNTEKVLSILEEMNYQVLRNQSATHHELNLIGFDDSRNTNQVANTLDYYNLVDPQRFNILLYHRPTGVVDAASRGVDLMLAGHTHGGQFFPFTIVARLLFDVPSGESKIGDTTVYLSEGVGLWGPKMRLGSANELTLITIHPER